jgi:hypothetical protein
MQAMLLMQARRFKNPSCLPIPIPDVPHLAKALHGPVADWFVLLGGDRCCIAQLRSLRQHAHCRKELVAILSMETVRRRDRMLVDTVIELSSPKVGGTSEYSGQIPAPTWQRPGGCVSPS